MKKISSLVSFFIVTIAALTAGGLQAVVDGAIALVSSDPSVLLVTANGDGTFHVDVVGTGLATLTVSADADLGDGVRTITQVFEFEVYDGATEADHFDLSISGVTNHAPVVAAAAETGAVVEPGAAV